MSDENAAHAPIGAVEPLSAEGLAAVRAVWERYGAPATGGRLLATVDAKDAEIDRLRFHLNEANQIMRSAYQIALREKDRADRTNWEAFAKRLHSELIVQHEVIYGALDGEKEPTDG